MAGSSSEFNADDFRAGIRLAMRMGLPPNTAHQPVFVLASDAPTYTKNGVPVTNPRLDASGKPIDPEVKIVPGAAHEVSGVLCAVEVSDASASDIATAGLDPVGMFRSAKAEVTLLDEEYAQVKGCKQLRYAGNQYTYAYTSQSLGLFDVGVTVMTFLAADQE